MYYFASDTHLGAGSVEEQRATEKLFVEWLDRISSDATAIFLCGDIFDFWYEYEHVVPKGFVRTLGKIAEITDRGTRVVFMAGNHDMWIRDYLSTECGLELYTSPTTFDLGVKRVHVAHGDNLKVKNNIMLRLMNSFFRSSMARFLFTWLMHPNIALRFGKAWSSSSRKSHVGEVPELKLRTVKLLKEYAAEQDALHGADLYIFGHVHFAGDFANESPHTIFTNDWSEDPHYVSLSKSGEIKLQPVK